MSDTNKERIDEWLLREHKIEFLGKGADDELAVISISTLRKIAAAAIAEPSAQAQGETPAPMPQPEGKPWDMKTAHEKAPELIAQLDEESERLTRYGGSGDALLNEAARVIEALTQPQPEGEDFEAWIDSQLDECDCGYGCPSGCGCRHSGEDQPQPEPTSKGAIAESIGRMEIILDSDESATAKCIRNEMELIRRAISSQQRETQEAAELELLRDALRNLIETYGTDSPMWWQARAALSAPQEASKPQVCGYPACGCNPKHCPLDQPTREEVEAEVVTDAELANSAARLHARMAELRASKEAGKVEAVADEPVFHLRSYGDVTEAELLKLVSQPAPTSKGEYHVEQRTNACADICDVRGRTYATFYGLQAKERADHVCAFLASQQRALSDEEIDNFAHSACEEALAFGLSVDVFKRYIKAAILAASSGSKGGGE